MATFRYTLRTPDAAVKFGTESVRNWQDVKPSIVRNDTYRGVFQTMTSTLEFTGVIRDLIIRTIDSYGYDAEIFLTIEIGNNNRERSSFEVFEGMEEMKAELSDIDITELAVSLNFVESGFVSDMLNREDVKVNLDVTETIDGDALPAYSDILKPIYLHDRKLIFNSILENNELDKTYSTIAGGTDYIIPLNITYRSDDNFKNVIDQTPFPTTPIIGEIFDNDLVSFYLNSDKARVLDLSIEIDLTLSSGITPPIFDPTTYAWAFRLWRKRAGEWSSLDTITSSVSAGGSYPDLIDSISIDVVESYYKQIEIEEGDSYALSLLTFNVSGTDPRELNILTRNFSLFGTSLESFEFTLSQCIRPFELFERLIHIITGEAGSFYSEYFGRTDLGYQQDGHGCNLAVLNGLMLRNFPIDKGKFNTSLKEAFEAFSKERNLVGTIETINNKKVFRIEPYADVYKENVVLKLGSVSEVSRSIDYEKIFTEIKVGGKDEEYEEVNGLYSFNGEFTFATPLKTSASILKLIGPYRKDDIGIELTRRQQYSLDPGKDYRADEDIFIIDSFFSLNFPFLIPVPFTGGLLIASRAQGYESIDGIFEPSRAYNLNLSPGRQLRHWGNIITSGLLQKSDKNLKFTKGAKNQDLISKKIGEDEIVEASDIFIQILDNPVILPDLIMIAEAKMTFDQYRLLSQNPTELVEFDNKGVQVFGYIKLAEFDFERNICNFELERANY